MGVGGGGGGGSKLGHYKYSLMLFFPVNTANTDRLAISCNHSVPQSLWARYRIEHIPLVSVGISIYLISLLINSMIFLVLWWCSISCGDNGYPSYGWRQHNISDSNKRFLLLVLFPGVLAWF